MHLNGSSKVMLMIVRVCFLMSVTLLKKWPERQGAAKQRCTQMS